MKYLRLFESDDISVWEEDFLSLYDIFCELEDRKIGSFDYQAGYRTSSGFGSNSYPCFLRNGEILGDKESIYRAIKINSKILFEVLIVPDYKNQNYSPFSVTNGSSFFGENAHLYIQIIKYIELAKNRLPGYSLGITNCGNIFGPSNGILINFLRNK